MTSSLDERVREFEATITTFDDGGAEWTLRRREARLQQANALIRDLHAELVTRPPAFKRAAALQEYLDYIATRPLEGDTVLVGSLPADGWPACISCGGPTTGGERSVTGMVPWCGSEACLHVPIDCDAIGAKWGKFEDVVTPNLHGELPAAPPACGPIRDGTPPMIVLAHVLARADEWYDGDGSGAGPLAASVQALRKALATPTAYAALVALLSPSKP